MKKLFVFVGDGGSGKTTLIAELTKRYPRQFQKLVTCTSRLPRKDEVTGTDYHFHVENYFIDNPELVLVKRTDKGDYYGTRLPDPTPKNLHSLLTLRFAGIQRLVALGLGNVTVINISITEDLKIARMRQRGDSEHMIRDRLEIDASDRAGVDWGQFPIVHLNAADTIDANVASIINVS